MKHKKGMLLMLIFCVVLPLVDSLSRILMQSGKTSSQVLFLEFIVVSALFLPFFKKMDIKSALKKENIGWHGLRIVGFFLAASVWVSMLRHVSVSQLYTIGFLAPLFTSILASLIFKESFGPKKMISLFLGFVGVLVIIRPGVSDVSTYLLIALLSPVFWSITQVATKRLTTNTSSYTLLFLMAIGMSALSGPFVATNWVPMAGVEWIYIGCIAIGGFIAHLSLITAYRHAPLTVVAPMEFSTLIFATIFSLIFFGEGIDMWTMLGAVFIIASNGLNQADS